MPVNRVTMILNGQRGVSADTALRLARYFGTTPQLWLNLQKTWELRRAEIEAGREIAERVTPPAVGGVGERLPMPVPDFQSLMLPALKALADGGETQVAEVCARVAAAEGLTPDDLLERTRGGHTTKLKTG